MIKRSILSILLASYTLFASAQEHDWNRIAEPGYPNYSPVTLANGVFGITFSEHAFFGNQLQMNGVFDHFPDKGWESSIRGIDFSRLELIVMEYGSLKDGASDFMKGKALSKTDLKELGDWKQEFNFREGWFASEFVMEGLKVKHTAFVLKHMSQTGIIKLEFTAERDLSFSLKNILTIDHPYRLEETTFTEQLRMRRIPLYTATASSPSGSYKIATSSSFYFEGEEQLPLYFDNRFPLQSHMGFQHELREGESLTCYLIGSMVTSYNYSDPARESAQLNIYTFLKGAQKVIREHKNDWENFWSTTDIIIHGDKELTKDMRQTMFFVNSFVRPGTDFSSACMGLGTDYWGYKTLWDADFWIYPALLLINPDAARSMLEHRWKRMDMARQNAMTHGYRGVMFPWESGRTGEDLTSLMYLTGPFQHHITADVGLAFWQYYCVTQDMDFLHDRAYPVLKEVAEFWVSRVEKNDRGEYEILNVVSPDEHAINVDNDVFTNAAAKLVLQAAESAANILGKDAAPEWSIVAEGLVFPKFKDGTFREHSNYEGEMIKQAATNLASFPLNIITEPFDIQKNLSYYTGRIDPDGPNMTWPMYAGAAARAGDADLALDYFNKGLQPYKKGPFKILALRPYLNTTFFGTSAGGILQAMIMGFGGLNITEEGLKQVDPVLPKGWKSIELKGMGMDKHFRVSD